MTEELDDVQAVPDELSGARSTSGLQLRGLTKQLGDKVVVDGLDLEVPRGELVSLLGPSGCGKTTTLRMVAGFLQPDAGAVIVADKDLVGQPPERRPSAMVFQNYALWPTMTVEANVSFPLRVRKVPVADRTRRVAAALEMVNLSDKARRRPARLSGGEQQRVALARALVQQPEVLLLDEPLSNLDAKLRIQVRDELRRIQTELGITTLVVTHDQDEALAISDRVAVMHQGRIEQVSDPVTLYRRPATAFVAGFIGDMVNLDGTLESRDGVPVLTLADGATLIAEHVTSRTPGPAVFGIRPEQVRLTGPDDPGSAAATVLRLTPRGHQMEAVLGLGEQKLRALVEVGAHRVGARVGVRLGTALCYRGGQLVDDAESEVGA